MKKMFLLFLLCLAGSVANANLIQNSSFESGLDNWTTYGQSGVSSIYFAVKDEAAYDGDYSMKVAARNGYGMIYQTVAVDAGAQMNVSFQALAVGGDWMMNEPGDVVDVYLKFLDASGAEISQPSSVAFDGDDETEAPILTRDNWQGYSLDFLTPDNTASVMLKIRALDGSIDGGRTDGTGVYIDSVAITAVPEPASMCLLGLGGVAALRRKRN